MLDSFIIVILTLLLLSGCDTSRDKYDKYGFTSSDCSVVYDVCLNKCSQKNTRSSCLDTCNKSKGMCEAVKVKGCMQNCQKNYGHSKTKTEAANNVAACKQRCMENKGVSF